MRTLKWTIGDLMGLVLVFALGIALARWAAAADRLWWLVGVWLGLVVAIPLATWVWFIAVPKWVVRRVGRGDPERRRRWLRAVVATPALVSGVKVFARYQLQRGYQADGRYAEAEREARAILRCRGLTPGFQSVIRQNLADYLDGQGRRSEAEAERTRADAVLKGGEDTFIGHLAQGKLLERQNRHAEACVPFERGLALVPDTAAMEGVRTEFMMRLALASFNAGRPSDAVRWASAVLEVGPDGPTPAGRTGWPPWAWAAWDGSTAPSATPATPRRGPSRPGTVPTPWPRPRCTSTAGASSTRPSGSSARPRRSLRRPAGKPTWCWPRWRGTGATSRRPSPRPSGPARCVPPATCPPPSGGSTPR